MFDKVMLRPRKKTAPRVEKPPREKARRPARPPKPTTAWTRVLAWGVHLYTALGLVMAVLDGHHDVGDAEDPAGSAIARIVRALPESVAAQVEAVRRTTAPAPDRAAARPDPTRPDPQAPPDAASARHAYADYLLARLAQAERWLP